MCRSRSSPMASTSMPLLPDRGTAPPWIGWPVCLPPCADVVRVGLVAAFARWKGQDVCSSGRPEWSPRKRCSRFATTSSADRSNQIAGGSQWSLEELHEQGADLRASGRLGFVGFQKETSCRSTCRPRCGGPRQHAAGAVRPDDCRGDGLRPRRDRCPRRWARLNCSRTMKTPSEFRPVMPIASGGGHP